jgi:DNA (cytosine-5)-methyltransferase 1
VQSKHIQTPDGVAESLYAGECRHGGGEPYVMDEQSKEPILLESNQNDACIWQNGICNTLPASMGMGGGYVPMVTGGAISFQERAGKPGGGKGILIQPERTGALSTLNNQSVFIPDVAHALSARHDGSPQPDKGNGANIVCAAFKAGNGAKANGIGYEEEKSPTLSAAESGTNQTPCVYDARGNGDGETAPTLTGDHQNRVTDYTALCVGNGQANQSVSDKAGALNTMHDQQAILTTVGALCARDYKGVGNQYVEEGKVIPQNAIVRRLTPLECERLQGYPDGWTDIGEWTDSKGKKHGEADSPRYKALGNSIALPFWQWMARRICAQYERTATMASLFDGIGGFPLVFSRAGAIPVWASEIEEFPIAVTKVRFPDESV